MRLPDGFDPPERRIVVGRWLGGAPMLSQGVKIPLWYQSERLRRPELARREVLEAHPTCITRPFTDCAPILESAEATVVYAHERDSAGRIAGDLRIKIVDDETRARGDRCYGFRNADVSNEAFAGEFAAGARSADQLVA